MRLKTRHAIMLTLLLLVSVGGAGLRYDRGPWKRPAHPKLPWDMGHYRTGMQTDPSLVNELLPDSTEKPMPPVEVPAMLIEIPPKPADR